MWGQAAGLHLRAEFGSALDPVAGGAAGTATGEQPTLLGRAQALAGATVGAAVGTASAAASTVAGAPRAALNTASNVTQSVYQRVRGRSRACGGLPGCVVAINPYSVAMCAAMHVHIRKRCKLTVQNESSPCIV